MFSRRPQKTATDEWKYQEEQAKLKNEKEQRNNYGRGQMTSSIPSQPPQSSASSTIGPPTRSFSQIQPRRIALPFPQTLAGIAVRIFDGQSFVRTESGHPVFDSVAATAQLGVDILHSSVGFHALKATGERILKSGALVSRRGRDPQKIEEYALDFLDRITRNFPVLLVWNLRAMNARTTKGSWDAPQGRSFPPQHAAAIELNRTLIDRLLTAREAALNQSQNAEAWNRFHTLAFRISSTIAHELCHVFTSYLLYDPTAHTPPDVVYNGEGDIRNGESGRYWEFLVYGGVVDMRQGTQIERVAIKFEGAITAVVIHPLSFRAIVNRDFSVLQLVDPDCCKEGGAPVTIRKDKWQEKYRDIFEAYSGVARPAELPRNIMEHALSGAGVFARLSADRLRDWTLARDVEIGGKSNWSCTVKMQA